ncbi:MAG: redox-regulated ATPase YchF [Patescibacteria group bacterium]|nr:redox-regulated ATPase YchF [Patescibacteria group bacterium]
MGLSIGIVGLPNVGKSTLFQALTKKQVPRENYPFCTIDPNVGVVALNDERVDKLAELTGSAKKIFAAVEFVDIAGLVKGAASGEGLGNQFLSHIRETNAICYVLRAFQNSRIVNTQEDLDVLRDKEILDAELILKDLETIEKRLGGLEKEIRAGRQGAQKEFDVLTRAKEILGKGKILSEADLAGEDIEILKPYQFLCLKKRIYLLNGAAGEISEQTIKFFEQNNLPFVCFDVLAELEAGDWAGEEREKVGLSRENCLDGLIRLAYDVLGLISFFTTGPDETRAWTLIKGQKAPQAGGVIHSDFEQYFIRAEVINWQELLLAGGFAKARASGLIATCGKDYVVRDGDVIEIKAGK